MGRHDAFNVVRIVQEDHGGVLVASGEGCDDGRRVVPPVAFGHDSAHSALLAHVCERREGLENRSDKDGEQVL